MLFAVIGDIRGNLRAFEAVLDQIDESGIHVIMHTGNAVVGGDGGDAVVDRLRTGDIYCVQGREDRLVARFSKKRTSLRARMEPEAFAAMDRAHAHTHSANLEFLRNLRKSQRIEMDQLVIYLSHGTGNSQSDAVGPETPVARLRRFREEALADIIVCGGGAVPFATTVDGAFFVCPGPVEAGPGRARYALVNGEEAPWSASFPEVVYDTD